MSNEMTAPTGTAAEAGVASDLPQEGQDLDSKVDELVGEEGEELLDEVEASEGASEEELTQEEEELKEQVKKIQKKLKVYGKEVEKELDLSDDEAITRELQKSAAFDHMSQEFSGFKKQVNAFMEQLQSNPIGVLQKMGYDVDSIAEEHLSKQLEEMNLDPVEKEKREMQRQLEEYKQQLEEQENARREAEIEQMRNQYAAEIETDIGNALEGGKTTLPRSPLVVKRVAETMMLAMQNGYPEVKAADVLPVVEKQFRKELKDMFGVLPEDALEELVGKDNFERLRKRRLKSRKAQTKTARQVSKETGRVAPKVEEDDSSGTPKKFSDVFDWRS